LRGPWNEKGWYTHINANWNFWDNFAFLWTFGNYIAVWNISSRFGILCQEKIWQPWSYPGLDFLSENEIFCF
jgi:hypothetical protein